MKVNIDPVRKSRVPKTFVGMSCVSSFSAYENAYFCMNCRNLRTIIVSVNNNLHFIKDKYQIF